LLASLYWSRNSEFVKVKPSKSVWLMALTSSFSSGVSPGFFEINSIRQSLLKSHFDLYWWERQIALGDNYLGSLKEVRAFGKPYQYHALLTTTGKGQHKNGNYYGPSVFAYCKQSKTLVGTFWE